MTQQDRSSQVRPVEGIEMIAAIGTIPAAFRTPQQRIGYMLSVLRSHQDATIAAAAKSLYDGSISLMSRSKTTSTPEAVVAAVLARRN